jgi:release factor glutamine methyltransferase
VSKSSARLLVRQATERLAAAGVESARHDAESLLAFVLGTSRGGLLADPVVGEAARTTYLGLVERRERREPLQHLTGRAYFRQLELEVGPGVFVPRPETELLAGAAIEELRRLVDAGVAEPMAVDLCTGSGAVALAIATEVPETRVVAVELSEQAFAFASRNASGVSIDLRLGDMAHAVAELAGQVHVVTANPPYIPLEAFESVEAEARDHDPAAALWSGADGLDAIRVVARVAADLLVDGGLVLCEHADVQGDSAPAVFASTGAWTQVRDHRDLAGRPRFVTACRVSRPATGAGTIGP